MKIIAVINQKGGVGKTTITANLAHALEKNGHRVTLIDMDPQGHLTASLGVFGHAIRGMGEVLIDDVAIESVALSTSQHMLLVPAGERLPDVENTLGGCENRTKLLVNALHEKFMLEDYVMIDCPPSSGLLMSNALRAADEVLIPVTGDFLGLHGIAQLMKTIDSVQHALGRELGKWIVLSRFWSRRKVAKEVMNTLLEYFPDNVLRTSISESAALAVCPGMGKTIFEYKPKSRSAMEFSDLADDIVEQRTM
ncbi:MAG: ParA family protein [Gammaproteobacteria bacterium]|nr:ParA family protein [Gammaproteobacteria bacterium]